MFILVELKKAIRLLADLVQHNAIVILFQYLAPPELFFPPGVWHPEVPY